MKKVIRCICIMALVALAFTSCKKDQKNPSFVASVQKLAYINDDKTIIDNSSISFEVGNTITVYNLNSDPELSQYAHFVTVESGNTVRFEKVGDEPFDVNMMDGGFRAFYPGGSGVNGLYTNQVYRPNQIPRNALPMAAIEHEATNINDVHFNFQCIFGVWSLRLYERAQRTLTTIEVVDSAPSAPTISLTIPDGVRLGNTAETATQFYITLRPMALYQGCHIILVFDNGAVKDIDLSQHDLTMRPGYVRTTRIDLDNFN